MDQANAPNPEPGTFRVIDSRTTPSLDPQRMGKLDTLVMYRTADGSVYPVFVPFEHPSESQVSEAIRAAIKERGQWQGKTYRL